MPLSSVDPTAALVVVDLQRGVTTIDTATPSAEVVDRSARLAEACRRRGHVVVLVNVDGRAPGRTDASAAAPPPPLREPDWAELVPELGAADSDVRVTKRRWGAFLGTDLDRELRERGVTQVFLTGIATTAGVESTARSAHDLGYHVVLVTDAMTDRSATAHDHAVTTVFPRLGETTTTVEVLAALA